MWCACAKKKENSVHPYASVYLSIFLSQCAKVGMTGKGSNGYHLFQLEAIKCDIYQKVTLSMCYQCMS